MLKLKILMMSSDGILRLGIKTQDKYVVYNYHMDAADFPFIKKIAPYRPGRCLQFIKKNCFAYMGPDGIIKEGGKKQCQSTQHNTGTQGSTG